MSHYTPSQKTLERYANVLINFALGGGEGIKKGDVVRISVPEPAKPLYVELRKMVLKAGGHPLGHYQPADDKNFNLSRDFYKLASDEQLAFFPKKYIRGLVNQIDHSVNIVAETNKHALEGIAPNKIMITNKAMKPWMDWLSKKERDGKFTWTVALYGTEAMAQEAGLSLEEYWKQIIKGCFLDCKTPIKKWIEIERQIATYRKKLNNLHIRKIHIEGKDADLWINIGEKRQWLGGGGRNIPSFEIFTSPDWRGTNGWMRFNQPLYRFGNLITDIELEFKKGVVVKGKASKNEKVLKEMIKVKNGNKIGEVSLTDSRFSHITKFMAETLFDENVGGRQGNCHIALGRAYRDTFLGNQDNLKDTDWRNLGFNDSALHTDIISTTQRTVTAYLKGNTQKVIYENGQFTI